MAKLLIWLLGVPISVALMIIGWGVPGSNTPNITIEKPTVSVEAQRAGARL
jgi:hypothetical protein